MVWSMTGYGRAQQMLHGREITVEMRSVNARYLEYAARLPRNCAFLEEPVKKLVAAQVHRGKVELSLTIQSTTAADASVQINWALAKSYQQALASLAEQLDLKQDMTVTTLTRFPDVLVPVAAPADPEELQADVVVVVQQVRASEGAKLAADVREKLAAVEMLVGQIEQGSAGRVKAYTERLYARLQELLADRNIEESRILTEAALFADKTAVDEETVRLRSHLAQYREILEMEEPIGRKLDFLTQELNREANTIGSKCQDASMTKLVVTLKSEIEKIREQIQNLE